MIYLGNAFSLGMLDVDAVLEVVQVNVETVQQLLADHGWVSCVGHADTALLFSMLLGRSVEMNRCSTSLQYGDMLLVGQYNGPRLPEGATSLPDGAKIRWYRVDVLTHSEVAYR